MPRIALVLFLLALAGPAAAEPRASTASERVSVLTPPLWHADLPYARSLRIYLPPGYATSRARYPVIYLSDGQNLFDDATSYVGEWGVDETLDALAAEGFQAIAVGIDHGGDRRMRELSPWHNREFGAPLGEAYLAYLTERVKPFVDANYRTLDDAASTAIVGSSMGGLMAHYALHARPDVFGLAGVLSPSFWFHEAAFNFPQNRPRASTARVFLSMGDAEGHEALAHVEAMNRLLRRWPEADAVALRIVAGGEHNEAQWRSLLPDVLRFLYRLPASGD